MSDREIKSVSSATGQFRTLQSIPRTVGGSDTPSAGKTVPVVPTEPSALERLAEKLTVANQNVGRDLRFEVDLKRNRAVIQVLDSETGEIIRQIPPEKAEVYLSGGGDLALRLLDASA
jgi:flagellar protein FlaG